MDETFSLSKTLLVRLLDAVMPRDDDPGPYGPIGPIMRLSWRDLSWVMLNPQPLPPDPPPDLWRRGPHPDPWRTAMLARQVIGRLVAEAQFGEIAAGSQSGQADVVRSHIFEFVDDFCGNRPPRWPRPWPWPPMGDPRDVRGLDLLVAGLQFHKAADAMTDNPLQTDFSAAADRFFATGLERMQSELS